MSAEKPWEFFGQTEEEWNIKQFPAPPPKRKYDPKQAKITEDLRKKMKEEAKKGKPKKGNDTDKPVWGDWK